MTANHAAWLLAVQTAQFTAWLLAAMAAVAVVICVVLSPWMVRQWWIGREIRALDDPLPDYAPGRIRRSRRARRRLRRDLVMLLVAAVAREDESAD